MCIAASGVTNELMKNELHTAIARSIDISDRRIAALIANGEDTRNTPAWRDAQDERRMVTLYARLNGYQA